MAGGDHSPAKLAYFAQRQVENEFAVKMFLAALCGLLALFMTPHWTRPVGARLRRAGGRPANVLAWPFVAVSRLAANMLGRKAPGFFSTGDALVTVLYVAINLACSLTGMSTNVLSTFSSRFGWMADANMCVAILLGLKNTPLAVLLPFSYERLNPVHQMVGYVQFVLTVLHASTYTAYFNGQGRLQSMYAKPEEIAGIVAGFAFLSIVVSGALVRRFWYEPFVWMHRLSVATSIVAMAFHQPDWHKKLIVFTIVAGCMWLLDILTRLGKLMCHGVNNTATLYPLPGEATRVVLKKGPANVQPGKHCFLWIPAIRKFELHPFTCHRSSPMEFTVKAHDGFTRDLHAHAVAHPGEPLTASFDGPYGKFPNPARFDKVVLIAGGAGATFTFGLLENLLAQMTSSSGGEPPHNRVDFIWSVRDRANLSWFRQQLDLISAHEHAARVGVSLHVTLAEPPSPSSEAVVVRAADNNNNKVSMAPRRDSGIFSPSSPSASESDLEKREELTEKDLERAIETRVERTASATDGLSSEAKEAAAGVVTGAAYATKAGRPDAATIIREAVAATPPNQRVLVAGCGPKSLMDAVRGATAALMRPGGPGVELHLEQFGW